MLKMLSKEALRSVDEAQLRRIFCDAPHLADFQAESFSAQAPLPVLPAV